MKMLSAQGATEYLVLLAVVLIVALVSVALLGFFPSMASDAQITQSQTYWRSASPIAITEWAAKAWSGTGEIFPYFRVRNNGAYPIRITGIVGGDGGKATNIWGGSGCWDAGGAYGALNISTLYYLGPGEEKYFASQTFFGTACHSQITASIGAGSSNNYIGGATSICQNSSTNPGVLQYPSFGFEYIEYLDNNQQITKREIGKPVIIKCLPPQ